MIPKEIRKMMKIAATMAGRPNGEWKYLQGNYAIGFNHSTGITIQPGWRVQNYSMTEIPGVVYFPTRESAMAFLRDWPTRLQALTDGYVAADEERRKAVRDQRRVELSSC